MGGKNSFWRKPGGTTFSTPKMKGFELSPEMVQHEKAMLDRQAAIASGAAPSIAQMQMNRNVDQTNRAALAMASSQRGASNPALAFRQAQIMGQEAQMQGAQEGAMMAEQERRQADQMIAQQAAAQRGVALQQSMANQQAQAQASAGNKQMISGLAAAGGQMAMASDERVKTDIGSAPNASQAIEAFVNAIKPHTYKYKNAEDGTGEKMGVMAQDLEKTAVGKTMVDEAPDGTKMVDTNKAIGVILAGMADMNKKLKKLEK